MPSHTAAERKKNAPKADVFAGSKSSTAGILKSFRQSNSLAGMDARMAAAARKKKNK